MVKSTREGEKLRGGPCFASPANTRFREEEQADFVSPTCSPEPMKGDTSVDPTEGSISKSMVPSQQLALTLVASAATEDPGSQLITSAIASKDQGVRIKSAGTSTDKTRVLHFSPVLHPSIYIYIWHLPEGPYITCPHLPEGPYITSMNPPSPEHLRSCALPVANTNPLKTDAALSAAVGPPGKLRGNDCSELIGTACVPGGTHGCSTSPASTLGEKLGPRTSRPEEDPRGRDRLRLLGTTSTLGEVLGDGTTAGAPGGALGRCAPTPTGSPRGTDGLRGKKLSQEGPLSRNQDSS